MLRAPSLGLGIGLAVVALSALSPPAPAGAAAPCDRFAAPVGSDAAAGTEAAPFATVQKLADSLGPGQTGCLRHGRYDGAVKVTSPRIALRPQAGERVTVAGRFWIARGADGVTVEGLYLDGRNPKSLPSPTVNAADAAFRRNDVTNGHTAICFNLGHTDYGRAVRTVIESNRIHNCGVLPAANHDHGIYLSASDDVRITGNWIYENADRGIQLYPDAQRTMITGNVIDGNGQGVIFSGAGGRSSHDNVVEGNVITNSRLRHNVESFYPSDTSPGTGNLLRRNCVRGGARDDGDGGIATPEGFTSTANLLRDPQYANRAGGDLRLAGSSPCRTVFSHGDAVPGPDGLPQARTAARRLGPSVSLRADRLSARRGRLLSLRGRAASPSVRAGTPVIVLARTYGRWARIGRTSLRSDGSFRLKPRLRVNRRARVARVRAVVRGVGRSGSVRLRLRRAR